MSDVFSTAFAPVVVLVALMIVASVETVIARIAGSRDRRRLDFLDLNGLSVSYGDLGQFLVVRCQNGTGEALGEFHHDLRTAIDSAIEEDGR